MATSYLKRTPSSPGSNTTGTVSAWVKLWKGADFNTIIGGNEGSSSTDRSLFSISADGTIYNQIVDGGSAYTQISDRFLSDPAAWYHVVFQFDTSNGVQADRVKTFINNEQITSWSTTALWPSSVDIKLWDSAASAEYMIGCRKSSSSYQYFFSGNMAHVHVVDGTVYAPSTFAETDSTSGIWIAKTSPSVTYGTNGGFYKFASGALGTDSAGSNNMTVVGDVISVKDNPDNNFCTLNPVVNSAARVEGTYTNSNNTYVSTTGNYRPACATIGLTAGLWYFEWKQTQKTAGQEELVGISGDQYTADNSDPAFQLGATAMEYAYNATSGTIRNNNAQVAYGVASAQNDIMGCYIDLTANKLYFALNGVIMNSGTGYSITAASAQSSDMWVPAVSVWSGTQHTVEFNFGNGYFGTTKITTGSGDGEADAGGEGLFNYDPSAGTFDSASKDFRAICTNNLSTYGG